MVARKGADRAKKLAERDALIRRSPVLSVGAKLLWAELARGWAWNGSTCFPNQPLLCEALAVSRRTLGRWMTELEDRKLISVKKRGRGNQYTLAMEIPEEICSRDRLDNRSFGHQKDTDAGTSGGKDSETTCATSGTRRCEEPASPCATSHSGHVPHLAHVTKTTCATSGTCIEASKMNRSSRNKEADGERVPTSSEPLACDPEELSPGAIHEGTSSGVGSGGNDLDDLLEDDATRQDEDEMRRRQRSPDLLGDVLPGSGLRNAGKPSESTEVVQASPMPSETTESLLEALSDSDGVLELLRREITEKFGPMAARGVPSKLSSKEKGQIKNTLLRKYEPDVILSMIRVLVWDWEIARETFWPPRPNRGIPLVENLVLYANDLAGAISTGLRYAGDRRGAENTYSDLFLEGKTKVEEDTPF